MTQPVDPQEEPETTPAPTPEVAPDPEVEEALARMNARKKAFCKEMHRTMREEDLLP